jgi:outer membrane protein assembly factor BamB
MLPFLSQSFMSRTRFPSCVVLACLAGSIVAPAHSSTLWNRFRGPNGSGHVETGPLPAAVDESTTLWKVPVGKGWSSPVVWGGMVVVTAETGDAKRAVLAFSVEDGSELWRHEEVFEPHRIHNFNSLTSSSAFIDGERVYVNWSTGTTIQAVALDHQGKLLWRNEHVANYIHEHGTGISPVVVDGIMLVRSEFNWERDGTVYTEDPEQQKWKTSFVGLDAATGKEVWKIELPNCLNTYSTPVVRAQADGKNEFICANNESGVLGIDVKTGAINWQYNPGYKQRSLGSGVLQDDFYFCTFGSGGGVKEVAAIDLKSGKPVPVDFEIPKGLPYVPSPLLIGEHMYLLGDGGIMRCVEFKTGKVLYEERVDGVQGSSKFFSSPVAGDGKIFCGSQQGDLIVIQAGTKYERLSAAKLDAPINATPAISDGRLFVRTAESLWCIGAKPVPVP